MDQPATTTRPAACGGCASVPSAASAGDAARALPMLERREFLSRATLAALGVVLAACGGAAHDGPTAVQTIPSMSVKLADYPTLDTVGGVAYIGSGTTALILVRTTATTVVAFSRICPHNGFTVSENAGEFLCPLHGARFKLTTGAWIGGQQTSNLVRYPATYDAAAGTVTIGG